MTSRMERRAVAESASQKADGRVRRLSLHLPFLCTLLLSGLALRAQTAADHLTVTTPAGQKVSSAPASNFTGTVQVQALFGALTPGRSSGGLVTFQPGARTHWHTHPLGQTLIVTEGEGWVQEWGQPRRTIRKGDVVQIPAGVKHWHGATSTMTLTHIAVQEWQDGRNVDWLEPVKDAQYGSAAGDAK